MFLVTRNGRGFKCSFSFSFQSNILSIRHIQHLLTFRAQHLYATLTQLVDNSITQHHLSLGRLHAIHASLITLVSLALVETLRWKNHISIVVTGNKVIQLAVVLHILILVALTVVVAPLIGIIAIPPQLTHRHIILNDAVLALQAVVAMHLSILLRRSHPVAITQLALLYRCRHSTIHFHLHILLATLQRFERTLYGTS